MYNKDKIIQIFREMDEEANTVYPYVVFAQPRRNLEETPAQHLDGASLLHVDVLGFSHGFCHIGGELVDVARNYLMDLCIESKAKYMFFVGEDTVIPYDGFLKLHEVAEQNPDAVVAGVYYCKMSSPMIHIKEHNYITPADVTPGRVFEALSAGLDAVLIPISILKYLKEEDPELPLCCVNNMNEFSFIGEDTFFYYRLRKAGFKLLINTDVQCLHMDLESGKYTAHPNINLKHYYTNIPITERLRLTDKEYIDKRWLDRVPRKKE